MVDSDFPNKDAYLRVYLDSVNSFTGRLIPSVKGLKLVEGEIVLYPAVHDNHLRCAYVDGFSENIGKLGVLETLTLTSRIQSTFSKNTEYISLLTFLEVNGTKVFLKNPIGFKEVIE